MVSREWPVGGMLPAWTRWVVARLGVLSEKSDKVEREVGNKDRVLL